MLLIPAINLKNGYCVRGKTVVDKDPVAQARRWVEAGARRLHVVDLDGAVTGEPANADAIHAIATAYPDLPVQVGGGIRNEETVQTYLEAGVDWVIIGTRAVTTPHFVNDLCLEFPGHIMVGLDARGGRLAIDGKLGGINVAATIELARAVSVPVFASGGVGSLDDVRALAAAREDNLAGAIVGRALYDGKLELAEAQRLADSLTD